MCMCVCAYVRDRDRDRDNDSQRSMFVYFARDRNSHFLCLQRTNKYS